jgi:hypothetical protein
MTGTRVSGVKAYSAHREWAARPPDERYATVQALSDAACARRVRLEERGTETVALTTEAVDDDVVLRDASSRITTLTHWSFGQLATLASAPPSYLRTLPAVIASSAINYGLQRSAREQCQLLVDRSDARARTRSRQRGTHACITTSSPAGCSTSWSSIRPGSSRSDKRTASMAPSACRPAPTWETEICSRSSWTEIAISTIPRTAPTPGCFADSFSGTAMSVPLPLP